MTIDVRSPLRALGAALRIAVGQRAALNDAPASAATMALALLVFVGFHALMGRAFIVGEADFSWSAWAWGWAPTAAFLGVAWFGLSLGRSVDRPALPVSAWIALYWMASAVPMGLYGLWW